MDHEAVSVRIINQKHVTGTRVLGFHDEGRAGAPEIGNGDFEVLDLESNHASGRAGLEGINPLSDDEIMRAYLIFNEGHAILLEHARRLHPKTPS